MKKTPTPESNNSSRIIRGLFNKILQYRDKLQSPAIGCTISDDQTVVDARLQYNAERFDSRIVTLRDGRTIKISEVDGVSKDTDQAALDALLETLSALDSAEEQKELLKASRTIHNAAAQAAQEVHEVVDSDERHHAYINKTQFSGDLAEEDSKRPMKKKKK